MFTALVNERKTTTLIARININVVVRNLSKIVVG